MIFGHVKKILQPKSKVLAALGLVFLCVLAVAAGRRYFSPSAFRFTSDERALLRSRGEPGSPVWIVEYMDYECPPCRQAYQIIEDYFKKNRSKIYFQVRFYPMPAHRNALRAAQYAECAAREGRFWKFHDILLTQQKEWSGAAQGQAEPFFRGYAGKLGLDSRRFVLCLEDPGAARAVGEDMKAARSVGVQRAPTFFMNGKMVVGVRALEEELKK